MLQRLMARAFDAAGPAVVEHAHAVTGRLQRVAQVARRLGRSASALGRAIQAIHAASAFAALMVLVVCVDWFADGEMDLLKPFL